MVPGCSVDLSSKPVQPIEHPLVAVPSGSTTRLLGESSSSWPSPGSYTKNRAWRLPHNAFGDASEEETTKSFPAVSRHYNHVGTQTRRHQKDLHVRIAIRNMNFVPHRFADSLSSQSFKLALGNGFELFER